MTSLQDYILNIRSKINSKFDFILLGDFNSRIGTPMNSIERSIIGKYGERTRNINGIIINAHSFLIRNNFLCLNNRIKPKNNSNYTYHQIGNMKNKSIIDLIFISKSMMRHENHAKVIPTTLTSHESHFPVITSINMSRNIPKPKPKFTKLLWNMNNLKNESKFISYLSKRDQEISNFINSSKNNSIESMCL